MHYPYTILPKLHKNIFHINFARSTSPMETTSRISKRRDTSFEFSSILLTVDLSKHLIMAWIIQKFIQLVNFVTNNVNYRRYREKRNKIIKFFRAPYMAMDSYDSYNISYSFLQFPTVTSHFLSRLKTWLPRQTLVESHGRWWQANVCWWASFFCHFNCLQLTKGGCIQ